MQLRLPAFTLCLLGAVLLCGAQNITSPAPTNSTGEVTNTTDPNPNITSTITTPVGTTPSSSTGLSDGAIAGITIGTIGGAGLLGGGVYGLLKYTGKI